MVAVALNDAASPFVLSVDVGTSSIKALAFDRHGRQIEGLEDRQGYSTKVTSDGGATFDVSRLLNLDVKAIDAVTAQAPRNHGAFAAVAFSTLWHSLAGLDAEGRPITPLSTWADIESAPAVPSLRKRLDESAVHFRTGCMFHPSFWPAKLILARTRSKDFSTAASWASLGDLLTLNFCGKLQTSLSIASGTGMFDGRRRDWDSELLDTLGVRIEQLPELVDLVDGGLPALIRWRKRWPGLAGATWMPAIGDGACGSVGGGSHRPDRAAIMIGTSGALRWILPDSDLAVPMGLFRYRLDRHRIVVGGALSAGGNTRDWIVRNLKTGNEETLDARIGEIPPDSHGLTVLPFFSGERSPSWSAAASAVIAGLTLKSTPVEIARATYEAVGYGFAMIERLAAKVVPEHEIIGSGGALESSPLWTRIVADVLQRPIRMSGEVETSSRGAALLALEALGLIPDLDSVDTAFDETVQPGSEHREIYARGLERHARLAKKIPSSRRM